MKLDLNKPLLNLDGSVIQVQGNTPFLGKILADQLLFCSSKDEMVIETLYSWSKTLSQGSPLEITPSELDSLKSIILECNLNVLMKKQILDILKMNSK